MKHDIFISYSRRDSEEVKAVKHLIEKHIPHIQIWFDEVGIESGDEFQDKIVEAIDNSEIVLFMLSENSLKSEWTKDEVMYAKNTGKRIIPVLLKGAELKGWFLFRFGRIDYIDASAQGSVNKLISNLSKSFPAQNKTGTQNIKHFSSTSPTNNNSNYSKTSNHTPEDNGNPASSQHINPKEANKPQVKSKKKESNTPHLTKEMLGFNDATFAEYIRATDGDGEAMYRLAQLYYNGEGMRKPNKDKYVYWLKKAADKGIVESYEELAQCDSKTDSYNFWLSKAYDAYKEEAINGDTEAMYQLGRLMDTYDIFDPWGEGVQWIEKAAADGHPEAMYMMFRYLFFEYRGVMKRDIDRGLEYFRKAWIAGSDKAKKEFASYNITSMDELIKFLKERSKKF